MSFLWNVFSQHSIRRELKTFSRFALVGVSNATIDFTMYLLFTRVAHIPYLGANAASWLIAVCWSFVLNKYWTFKVRSTDKIGKESIKFFLVSLGSLLLSTIALALFVRYAGVPDIFAKVLTIGIVTFWNFSMHRLWTFRHV